VTAAIRRGGHEGMRRAGAVDPRPDNIPTVAYLLWHMVVRREAAEASSGIGAI
jgi:hypothetical protein